MSRHAPAAAYLFELSRDRDPTRAAFCGPSAIIGLMSAVQKRHIAIVGLMGVGKTTVAEHLSRATGIPTADSDRWIEHVAGLDAATLASADGVRSLHELEADTLEEMLAITDRRIITPAASTIDDEESRRLLQEHAVVVWLDAPMAVLRDRMPGGSHRRPLDEGDLEALIATRSPLFAEVADLRLDATDAPHRIVQRILERFPFS